MDERAEDEPIIFGVIDDSLVLADDDAFGVVDLVHLAIRHANGKWLKRLASDELKQ